MKLVLGTAQLGLNYGINNKGVKPSRGKSLAILDHAWVQGIKIFDTAHAYGDAEEILGEFIASRNLRDKISIISKFRLPETRTSRHISSLIQHGVEKSLQILGIDCLDGYLLHTPGDIRNPEVMASLRYCQDIGLVKNIGVSVYEGADALYAAKSGLINYIQIPYSVFDQRLNRTDFFGIAKDNQVKVLARSVFLQGLIFMSEPDLPDYLHEAGPYLREFDDIIKRHNLTREQAALLFVYKNKNIDYVVLGVEDIEQLDRNIKTIKESGDRDECWAELKNKFVNIQEGIVSPNLWPSSVIAKC